MLNPYLNSENEESKIDDQFKKETELLKQLWVSIKLKCDADEERFKNAYRIEYVKKLEKDYFPLMNVHFQKLALLSGSLSASLYQKYKEYLRNNLCDLMVSGDSPLNKQIYDKPFGYAGDFVVANFFYENGYSGTSLWGMLMDRFTVQSSFAIAHRNRRKYIGNYIEKLATNNLVEQLNITSLACGPAPEVFDALDKNFNHVTYTLIDGEKKAIDFIGNKIKQYKLTASRVNLFQENILNLLRNVSKVTIAPQDFIYCAGFFDYIKDTTAKKCIKFMLKHLKPGGILLILNVSRNDEKNVCLKMLADWNLNHRSEKEMLGLLESIQDIFSKEIWCDKETLNNVYMLLKKA